MPPRTIADATRFTPTGPHAFTSPIDRVSKLRNKARETKAKKSAGTLLDRAIDRGRTIADIAHRVTAVGLILATVACAGITVYAFTDMVMFKRQQRAALIETARQDRAAVDAAAARGVAEAVVAVREREDARPRGPWEKAKAWAMSGMTPADREYKTAFEREVEDEVVRKGDELVKRDPGTGAAGGTGGSGVLSSVTGWWSGK